ncbi:hypothetical protein DV704_09685 [Meiothermus sp. QL-1]|uniref:hypothetical protein n=1 Tax=Meiothermus sp. QL-1 TaxID=2058095 RepID=UPI000E0B52F2|nr:hypothetical protein [Meiothermus sp. QL-1]RDI94925.1 hypothetical protein DV704_09685 [Meiothermus sp. QL-1]
MLWRVGSTGFGTGLTASRTFNTPGSYTISVQATDDAPAPHTLSGTDTRTLTVVNCTNNPPTASITNPPSDLDVDFNGTDENGWYYQLTLQASASDPDGNPLTLQWFTNRGDVQPGPPASGD